MSAQPLEGRDLANLIKAEVKDGVEAFVARHGITPTLCVIRIGDDDAAVGYSRAIGRACASVGIDYVLKELATAISQDETVAILAHFNNRPSIHGLMVLEPTPAYIDYTELINMVDPAKDVDGAHSLNAGRLLTQRPPYFVPATPTGGIELMESAGVEFKGKHAVVVGRSNVVGKPMALLLLQRHCTVTIAHSRTEDLASICRSADILCLAVGQPELVRGDWVKPGAVVVDFGMSYTDHGLRGDCDHKAIEEIASILTPVPGGTGPMTNAVLMRNVLAAASAAVGG